MHVRDFENDDWTDVWPIFDSVVSRGDTYALPRVWESEAAFRAWAQQPSFRVFVAVEADSIVGTAKLGPNRDGPGSHVATASFMVAPNARGLGVGRALGEHVLEQAKGAGFSAMQFNAVVETNLAAIALWESMGFRVVGTVPDGFELPDGDRVGLHIMHRHL